MVYHFQKKLDAVEKKNDTLQDICKTICEELDYMKSEKPPIRPPTTYNVDPFYMNFASSSSSSGGGGQQNNIRHEFIPNNITDLFKTIIVSEDILSKISRTKNWTTLKVLTTRKEEEETLRI
jgi:hypothetical protein